MNCSQCHKHVLDYAYDELPEERAREVAEALTSCPECRAEVERLRATRAMLREGLVMHEPSGLLRANILREARKLHAAREEAEVGVLSRLQSLLVHPSFAMAAGVLLVVCVTLVLQDRGTFDPSEEAPRLASAPIPSVPEGGAAKADQPQAAAAQETPAPLLGDGDSDGAAAQAQGPPGRDAAARGFGGVADDAPPAEALGAAGAPQTNAPKKDKRAAATDAVADAAAAEMGEVWSSTGAASRTPAAASKAPMPEPKPTAAKPAPNKADALTLQADAKTPPPPKAAPAPVVAVNAPPPPRAPALDDTLKADEEAPQAEAIAKAKVAEASQRRSVANSSVGSSYSDGNVLGVSGAADERERYGRGGYGLEAEVEANDPRRQAEMKAEPAEDDALQAPAKGASEGAGADAYAAKDSDDPDASFVQGNNRYDRGDYRGAITEFNNFINEAPRTSNYHAQAIYRLGRSHMGMGQWDKAAVAFRRVLSEYPDAKNRAEIRYYLAQALLKANPKSTEAEQILNDLARGGGGGYAEKARSEHDRAFGRSKKDSKARSPKAAPARKRAAPSESYDLNESFDADKAAPLPTQE